MPSGSWNEWFDKQRARLTGNGIALDGGEPGRPDPSDFERASLRILICRLSTCADVLESITHRMLFWAARQVPGVYADLAFLPPPRDAALMTRDGVPWWLASGCRRAPAAFDVVAVSISVQQEALNLPAALHHSGLQLSRAARLAPCGASADRAGRKRGGRCSVHPWRC